MIPQLQLSEGPTGILKPTYVLNQAPYLTNNWKSIQVSETNDYCRFIKIQDGIATITNGETLLRCRVPGVPNGFYTLDDSDILVDAEDELREGMIDNDRYYPSSYSRSSFPDPESVRPNFKALTHTPPILRDEVRVIMDFLNHVRGTYDNDDFHSPAIVCVEGATISSWKDRQVWLQLSCEIPVNAGGEGFGANRLRQLMADMLRYDHIFIGKDHRPVGNNPVSSAPLVVGLDWSSCGIIKPRR
jgi:hypothetical protein